MARYDYGCVQCRRVWEVERPIADRHQPTPCPRGCRGDTSMLQFSPPPASNIRTPRAFRTNWSDVAPSDANGHTMSFTETVKSGRFDEYHPGVLETEMKLEDKRQASKKARLRKKAEKRFMDAAYGKVAV